MIIDTLNINEVRRQIQKIKKEVPKEEIIVISKDDDYNRKILEMKDVDVLLLSFHNRKDKLKQRDSGLNEVFAKLAKENNIRIGLDINELKKLNKLIISCLLYFSLGKTVNSHPIFLHKKIFCLILLKTSDLSFLFNFFNSLISNPILILFSLANLAKTSFNPESLCFSLSFLL